MPYAQDAVASSGGGFSFHIGGSLYIMGIFLLVAYIYLLFENTELALRILGGAVKLLYKLMTAIANGVFAVAGFLGRMFK